jgi:hypothetical protein
VIEVGGVSNDVILDIWRDVGDAGGLGCLVVKLYLSFVDFV